MHYRSAPERGRLAWACKQYAWRSLLVMQSLMDCWETSVKTLPEIDPCPWALSLDPIDAICFVSAEVRCKVSLQHTNMGNYSPV